MIGARWSLFFRVLLFSERFNQGIKRKEELSNVSKRDAVDRETLRPSCFNFTAVGLSVYERIASRRKLFVSVRVDLGNSGLDYSFS